MPKHPASEANNLRTAIGRGQISAKVPAPRNSAERAFARRVRREEPGPPPEPPERGGLPLSVWLIVAAALAIAMLVLVFH